MGVVEYLILYVFNSLESSNFYMKNYPALCGRSMDWANGLAHFLCFSFIRF